REGDGRGGRLPVSERRGGRCFSKRRGRAADGGGEGDGVWERVGEDRGGIAGEDRDEGRSAADGLAAASFPAAAQAERLLRAGRRAVRRLISAGEAVRQRADAGEDATEFCADRRPAADGLSL